VEGFLFGKAKSMKVILKMVQDMVKVPLKTKIVPIAHMLAIGRMEKKTALVKKHIPIEVSQPLIKVHIKMVVGMVLVK
jgi:hypothetical protein